MPGLEDDWPEGWAHSEGVLEFAEGPVEALGVPLKFDPAWFEGDVPFGVKRVGEAKAFTAELNGLSTNVNAVNPIKANSKTKEYLESLCFNDCSVLHRRIPGGQSSS